MFGKFRKNLRVVLNEFETNLEKELRGGFKHRNKVRIITMLVIKG